MGKLNQITLLLIFTPVILSAQSLDQRIYWPGMWRAEQPWGQFELGYWYNDQFNVTWSVNPDPSIGYPYASTYNLGLFDTVRVTVVLDNRSEDDIPLGTMTPEEWFYPVLYDPYVDVFKSPPLADTSVFDYRFEYWVLTVFGRKVARPDTLYSLPPDNYNKRYAMVYSIWGVGAGTFRVIIKPTSSKPDYVKISLDSGNNIFEMRNAQYLQDTLNSYSALATGALGRKDFTTFNTYIDSIFYRDSQSLIGWALRYNGYNSLLDTTNALAALDSFLVNIRNRIDPLIPDSSNMSSIHKAWLKQWEYDYRYYKHRMLRPEEWFGPFRRSGY